MLEFREFQNNKYIQWKSKNKENKAGTDGILFEPLKTYGANFNMIFHQMLTNIRASEKMKLEYNLHGF